MSRQNTPSILSSLTAYDSSGDEEEMEASSPKENAGGQVTLLLPPAINLIGSSPLKSSPSSVGSGQSGVGTKMSSLFLVPSYDMEEEENFEYQRPPSPEEEESVESVENLQVCDIQMEIPVDGEEKENLNDDMVETPFGKRRRLIPPKPEGQCPPQIEQKFAKMLELKLKGRNPNKLIQQMKDFRNPSLYEKLIQHCNIDENGTNFPNQPVYAKESYYDELDKVQMKEMERRFKEKERKAKLAAARLENLANAPPTIAIPELAAKLSNLAYKK